jgi:hypothetical protein
LFNGWEGSFPAWRGAALNLFNAGADGLYLFNPALGDPRVWREIGEVSTMAGKDRLYGIDRFAAADSFEEVAEVDLEPGIPVATSFQAGEEVGKSDARRLDFSLHLWNHVAGDRVAVKLNGTSIPGLKPAEPGRNPERGQWLEGEVEARQVNRGENQLEVAVEERGGSASETLVMDAAQLWVRCEH